MSLRNLIPIIMITLGLVALALSGSAFTTPGKPIQFLGMTIETTDRHFVPPVAGALILAGGVVLLLINQPSINTKGQQGERPSGVAE
jgi:hypothetical protein